MTTNNNTNTLNSKEIRNLANKFKLTKSRISDFLSTAWYGNDVFAYKLPEESKKLITITPDDCIEDNAAAILKKLGVVQVVDFENQFSKAERCEVYGKVVTSSIKEFSGGYAPVYDLTLKRMVQAVQEIQNMDENDERNYLKRNYRNLFIEDCGGDFCDAYCLLQFFIFGEVVYG